MTASVGAGKRAAKTAKAKAKANAAKAEASKAEQLGAVVDGTVGGLEAATKAGPLIDLLGGLSGG
jgi:hypothetical protein